VIEATELLRRSGARATAVRVRVLEILLRAGCPVSQPDLTRSAELAGCDRVTLYRTLKLLREAGLAHAVQGVDGSWRFCAQVPGAQGCPGNHPHFLCLSCGRMVCLAEQKLPHVEVPPGVEVQGKQLVVYGRCRPCAEGRGAGSRAAESAAPARLRGLRAPRATRTARSGEGPT